MRLISFALALSFVAVSLAAQQRGGLGFYRFPALHGGKLSTGFLTQARVE